MVRFADDVSEKLSVRVWLLEDGNMAKQSCKVNLDATTTFLHIKEKCLQILKFDGLDEPFFTIYLQGYASTITGGNENNGVALQGLPYTIKNHDRYNPAFTIGRTYKWDIDSDKRVYSYGTPNTTTVMPDFYFLRQMRLLANKMSSRV